MTVDNHIQLFRSMRLEQCRDNLKNGVWFVARENSSKVKGSRQSLALEENRNSLLEMDSEMGVLGKSVATRIDYINILHDLAEFLCSTPFKEATKEKLKDYFNFLKERERKGRLMKDSTCNHRLTVVKTFYRWLSGGGDFPECVKWIKPKPYKNYITSETILTQDEIRRMVDRAKTFRNKAIIAVLYESACRISEFLEMRIGDISYDDNGARVRVSGKTGEREIRLVNSVPYLKEWLKVHPSKDNINSYVWVNDESGTDPLSEHGINTMLKRLRAKCGIQKSVHPHIFRHTRITELAARLSGTILNNYVGWKTGSNMSEVYVHHKRNEIDKTVLRNIYNVTNLDKAEEVIERLLPQVCHNCGEKNMAETDYCSICRMPLKMDEFKKRVEHNEWFANRITSSPEMFQVFVKNEIRKAIEELMKIRAR